MADRAKPVPGLTSPTDRAVAPTVAKAMEAAIVVLFISVVTTGLYAGVVPEYRSAAGGEVGERALAAAAGDVEGAVPPTARSVEAETRVDLPTTVRGEHYRIEVTDGALRLTHPDDAIGGTRPLALPDYVVRVEGGWHSTDDTVVIVTDEPDGLVVRLEAR